jgi:hypothetical protein
MSVICAVKFADGVITKMTVFDYRGDSLDIGRALNLAVAAYRSRTGHHRQNARAHLSQARQMLFDCRFALSD